MATILREIRMQCTGGGHNKAYTVKLLGTDTGYEVTAAYGRIGSYPRTIIKYSGISLRDAGEVHDALCAEKLAKGYIPVAAGYAPPAAFFSTPLIVVPSARGLRSSPKKPAGDVVEFYDDAPRVITL